MPHPTTNPRTDDRPSMSARVCTTRAEVARIDEATLSQMKTRLERWGAELNTLEINVLALRGDAGSEIHQSIDDLRVKYQIARLWFDQSNDAGTARWRIFGSRIQSAFSDFEMALAGLRIQVAPEDSPKSDDP